MHNENSDTQLQARLNLLSAYEAGALDSIQCPQCHKHSVSVRFTHPSPKEYRTWFVCSNCSFQLRTQTVGVPLFFTENRIDEYLEAYDVDLLKKRKFL